VGALEVEEDLEEKFVNSSMVEKVNKAVATLEINILVVDGDSQLKPKFPKFQIQVLPKPQRKKAFSERIGKKLLHLEPELTSDTKWLKMFTNCLDQTSLITMEFSMTSIPGIGMLELMDGFAEATMIATGWILN